MQGQYYFHERFAGRAASFGSCHRRYAAKVARNLERQRERELWQQPEVRRPEPAQVSRLVSIQVLREYSLRNSAWRTEQLRAGLGAHCVNQGHNRLNRYGLTLAYFDFL